MTNFIRITCIVLCIAALVLIFINMNRDNNHLLNIALLLVIIGNITLTYLSFRKKK